MLRRAIRAIRYLQFNVVPKHDDRPDESKVSQSINQSINQSISRAMSRRSRARSAARTAMMAPRLPKSIQKKKSSISGAAEQEGLRRAIGRRHRLIDAPIGDHFVSFRRGFFLYLFLLEVLGF